MYQPLTSPASDFTPSTWFVGATASLAAGVVVYAAGRPYLPEIIHTTLLKLGMTAQISRSVELPFAYQLPSFFHMLALFLATVAITHRAPKLRRPALLVTFILGMAMEFVQHPAVNNILEDCIGMSFCGLLSGVTAYALAGTYDRLDVLAIVLAACTTYLLLWYRRLL